MTWYRRIYDAIRFVLQVRGCLTPRDVAGIANTDRHRSNRVGDSPHGLPVVISPPPIGVTFAGEVVKIIDGDTVEIETRLRHRVRLLDCWCKETTLRNGTTPAEKMEGRAASAYLQALLQRCGNRVTVHIPGNGGDLSKLTSMSRVLGRMWRDFGNSLATDHLDISGLMVDGGHATKTKDGE